ncbi:MAG: TM0106 family RecB-like putative nuclease [Candidatus Atribacteria bacterium]
MRIPIQVIYNLFAPSYCEKRLYFAYNNVKTLEPGPFEQLIYKLGLRHEKNYLNSIGEYIDVSTGRIEERIAATKKYTNDKVLVIYQGVLCEDLMVNNKPITLIGIPDFLIYEEGGYQIRDCKLARHVDDKKHQEIIAQIKVYGLLLEKLTGQKVDKMEAVLGDNSLLDVTKMEAIQPGEILTKVVSIAEEKKAPYSPVGWSKCMGCGYRNICWDMAVKNSDVALVYGVDQGLARFFWEKGITKIRQLLDNYDEASLARVNRPWGEGVQKVGKKATKILMQAQAMKEKRNILIKKVNLPSYDNYVMFDLEGVPPYIDDLEKIYLWGIQVFGEKRTPYLPALAPIEEEGDYKGWENFLKNSRKIFKAYGDVPFIHWAPYEKTKIKLYLQRYGDSGGIAERVLKNLVDLCALVKKSLILAEPSYSLKVVEKVAGFKRTQEEYGGNWAIAKYIEAVETDNKEIRRSIIEKILKYNQEDLVATWEVFKWLKKEMAK